MRLNHHYAAPANRKPAAARQMIALFSSEAYFRQHGASYAPGFSSDVSPMSSTSASTSAWGTDDISIL